MANEILKELKPMIKQVVEKLERTERQRDTLLAALKRARDDISNSGACVEYTKLNMTIVRIDAALDAARED